MKYFVGRSKKDNYDYVFVLTSESFPISSVKSHPLYQVEFGTFYPRWDEVEELSRVINYIVNTELNTQVQEELYTNNLSMIV